MQLRIELTADDLHLEVKDNAISRKRKHCNGSSSCFFSSASTAESTRTVLDDQFMSHKRTAPRRYCPKPKAPTRQLEFRPTPSVKVQPTREHQVRVQQYKERQEKENQMVVEPIVEPERPRTFEQSRESAAYPTMSGSIQDWKAYRRQMYLDSEKSKKSEEEPVAKKQKKQPRGKKQFWEKN